MILNAVSGEDRYQYELRVGHASSEWVHPGKQALPNRYLANHLVMTDAAFGAQLKRNVEETVLAGQWAS